MTLARIQALCAALVLASLIGLVVDLYLSVPRW
jgi:hypothetical protein